MPAVTIDTVKELLQQQKEYFMDLLQQQERSYKSFVELILDAANKRCDTAIKETQELKTSLEFSQGEIDSLRKELSALKMQAKADDIGEKIRSVNETLLAETARADYLEAQSRRSNLIFEGIGEIPEETWADSEKTVKDILVSKLGLSQDIELERVHRIARKESSDGGPSVGNKPRGIIVKFLRFKDRSMVLANAKKLKGSDIYINEDFIDSVRKKRKELMPAMWEARKRGEVAFLRYDKLVTYKKRNA